MRRITPEEMTENDISKGDIFVFGSNESGIHGSGAARFAMDILGARLGVGFGLTGNCFAIPTKDWEIETLPLEAIQHYVDRFLSFTQSHIQSDRRFFVTKIGCGLAGYSVEDIAPLFAYALELENVYLPEDFINILENDSSSVDEPEISA